MITPVEAQSLIEEIEKSKHRFNSWEINFMTSIKDLIKFNRNLSDRRSEALQQIYRKSQGA